MSNRPVYTQIVPPMMSLDNASLANLTLAPVPPVSNHILLANEIKTNLTDKITEILRNYSRAITIRAGSGPCPDNVVAYAPVEMFTELKLALNSKKTCNYQISSISKTIDSILLTEKENIVEIPRLFMLQLSQLFDALKQAEKKINVNTAVTKILSETIALHDLQTLPNDTILHTNVNDNPALLTHVADTIVDAPQTIGLPSPNKLGTNVELDADILGENVSPDDDFVEIENQINELFSAKTLMMPINKVLSLGDLKNGHYETTVLEPTDVIVNVDFDKKTVDKQTVIVMKKITIDPTLIDVSKSYVENLPTESNGKYFAANGKEIEVTGFLDGLKSVWKAIRSVKMPSFKNIGKVAEVANIGLKTYAEISGNKDLNKITNVLDIVENGLQKTNATDLKSLVNDVPNILKIGIESIKNKEGGTDRIIEVASKLDSIIKSNHKASLEATNLSILKLNKLVVSRQANF